MLEKRLNMTDNSIKVRFTDLAHHDIECLCKISGRSKGGLIQFGLALAKLAILAKQKNHRLVITTNYGLPIEEICI